jgi:hypothetical protein
MTVQNKPLTPAQAAEFLNLKPATLAKLRCNDRGPEYLRIGYRTVRYMPDALAVWLESCTFTSTSDEAAAR